MNVSKGNAYLPKIILRSSRVKCIRDEIQDAVIVINTSKYHRKVKQKDAVSQETSRIFRLGLAREAAKSGEILFVDAMENFKDWELRESFERFEKAAMRGHEESQWIWNVVKDMELKKENREAIEKAFAETEKALGYYFAGMLCDESSRERFDNFKKSHQENDNSARQGQDRHEQSQLAGPDLLSAPFTVIPGEGQRDEQAEQQAEQQAEPDEA